MKTLSNKKIQEAFLRIPNTTINHTKTHTVISRANYSCHVRNIRIDRETGQPEKADTYKRLWDEGKNYAPLNLEHLKLRAEVSYALEVADER